MRPEHLGLVIGGLIPALFYGIDGTSSKLASRAGISWAPLMLVTGLAVVAVGAIGLLFDDARRVSLAGAGFAALKGVMWASGCVLVIVGIARFEVPLSKLVPLYSLSTVFAVTASLILFREHLAVDLPRLLIGTLLAIAGAALVATS